MNKGALKSIDSELPPPPRERLVCAIGRVVLANTEAGFVVAILHGKDSRSKAKL